MNSNDKLAEGRIQRLDNRMTNQLRTIADADHDRQNFIGSSDVAGILGISPWKTPLAVYLDKIQPRDDEPDRSKARIFARGKRMEPYVVDMLAEEMGIVIVGRNNRYEDAELPFLAAEIDAETEDGRNVEIKTVSPFKAFEWGEQQTDAIPIYYTAQAMHGLMVTGRDVCIFGVLIGGDDFRIYQVERDDETIDAIRRKEVEFWARVQHRDPPDPSTTSDVLALFERDTGRTVEADIATVQAIDRLREIRGKLKSLEKEQDELKASVHRYMQDAAVLTYDRQDLATWKAQSANRFDLQAFTEAHPDLAAQFRTVSHSRVFRLR